MLRVTEVTSHNSRVHTAARPSEPHRDKGGRAEKEMEVKRSMNQREKKHKFRKGRQRDGKQMKIRGSGESSNLMRTAGKLLLFLL